MVPLKEFRSALKRRNHETGRRSKYVVLHLIGHSVSMRLV